MDMSSERKLLLTVEETAHYLKISRRTLSRLHARGKGPPRIKYGGCIRYSVEALNRWLKAQETEPVRLRLPP